MGRLELARCGVGPPPQHVPRRAGGHGLLPDRLLLLQVLEVLPRRLLRPEARRGAGGLRRALRHREAAALEPPRRVARREVDAAHLKAYAPYVPLIPVLI